MQKRRERKKKFNMRYLIAALSFFFAVGLLEIMLSAGGLKSYAAGIVAPEQNSFWSTIYVPANLKLSQEVSAKGTICNNVSYDTTYTTDTSENGRTFEIEFPVTGVFKPTISVKTVNSHGSTGMENKWTSLNQTDQRYFSYVYTTSKGATTYYKVYTNGETATDDMSQLLLTYYKNHYRAPENYKCADNMMITTKDEYGRAFISYADQCANAYGWKKYTPGTSIPLLQSEKEYVTKITMLTVNPIDFYFTSYKAEGNGTEDYKHSDLDVMLYTPHTYTFKYRKYGDNAVIESLVAPNVTMESEKVITTAGSEQISVDDVVILSTEGNEEGTARPQYYLSDQNISVSAISWIDYQKPFSTNGKGYLYVRNDYKDGNKHYTASEVQTYKLSYMGNSGAVLKSSPENAESVDVGTKITLSQSGAPADAAIFYAVNAQETPTLTRVGYEQRSILRLDQISADGKYAQINNSVYLKINGIWYQCSDSSVVKYTEPIEVGEEIRIRGSMVIHAFIEDTGKEIAGFQNLRFSYAAAEETKTPESTIKTSVTDPTTVKMGSTIGLMCGTTGSKIFYTTNGSAPVIKVTAEDGPVAVEGTGTKLFKDSEPIVVNAEIAGYGESFMIMAQAVTYRRIGDNYYCIYQDSPVARFNYKIAALTPVEGVQSIPQTNAQTPTEVQVGSKIQLYSNTAGAVIYYTLDGSEPTFSENGEPLATTKKYSGAKGILIEKPTDSSLLTITAMAYKDGLAVSDISRLVFAYPGAVASPYANPLAGAVTENTPVVLESATKGAVIYYEIAYGENVPKEPSTSSKVFNAENPIVITKKTTIKAFSVKDSIESAVSTFRYTVSEKLKVPTPSIATGSVVSSGTMIALNADLGTNVFYTLDGSDPRESGNKKVQVGNNVVLNEDAGNMVILRTYASKSGYTDSEVGTYSYTISAYTGGIYADREDGETVKNGETIHLYSDMSDATIYYTTDGSSPSLAGHSGDSVTVAGETGEQFTIMAMAVAKGSERATSFATFTYTIMNKLAAPTSSIPDGAIFIKESKVELKAEAGRIYYTTDGTEPTTSSSLYKKSILIDKEMTIRAIVVAEDLEQSDVSTFHYGFAKQVAAPIASYASGELEMGTKVSFSCATEGATIYYRTDGKEINLSEKSELEIYQEPITINKATNFKVIAVKDKMQDSKVLTVGYTVKEPVVIEIPEEETKQIYEDQSNRLQSRRSFSDTESGPSYTDVVLRNASYGAVVAAEEGVLPDTVQLKVESASVTDAVNRRVQQVIRDNYGVVASYDVTLLVNGEETQPDGTIEIGLPIPVEYENAMLHIVHVLEDGNIELYETRRSGGIAYAKVDHLSVYSIAAPVEFEEEKAPFPWMPVTYCLAVGLTGFGCFLIHKAKKERREDGMQDE